jgi:hypothetical protein
MDASPTLTTDLPCHRCHYNLRGLPSDSRCPECGEAIASSVAAANPALNAKVAHWFNQLALGALLLAGAAVVACLIPLSYVRSQLILYLFAILAGGLAAAGTWLLACRDPARISDPGDGAFTPLFRFFAIASALFPTLLLIDRLRLPFMETLGWIPFVLLALLLVVLACAISVFLATLWIHLRLLGLGRRIASRSLQIQAIFYAEASLILMVASAVHIWEKSPFFIAGVGTVGRISSQLATHNPLLYGIGWLRCLMPIWAFCLFTFAAFRFHMAGQQARQQAHAADSMPAKQIDPLHA